MLTLKIPQPSGLCYRARLLADPATMAYNAGYHLDVPGYDNATGTLAFPPYRWARWAARWLNNAPLRYYAYVLDDGAPVGSVAFHYEPARGYTLVEVLVEAEHRGKGYCARALRLLAREAFETYGLEALYNDPPLSRTAAQKGHARAGFVPVGESWEGPLLCLTRQRYFETKAQWEAI